jgi:uncharacterized OsmC-like protein
MSHRIFQFRLHDQPGQADATPVVERFSDAGVWEVQQSDLSTPPFRLSLISLLLCLRYHLVSEARDRQIPLRELRATLSVEVTQDWDIERWSAAFSLLLDEAADGSVRQRADAVALAAMRTRMERSPVARNLSPTVQKRIDVVWTN